MSELKRAIREELEAYQILRHFETETLSICIQREKLRNIIKEKTALVEEVSNLHGKCAVCKEISCRQDFSEFFAKAQKTIDGACEELKRTDEIIEQLRDKKVDAIKRHTNAVARRIEAENKTKGEQK